MEVCPKMHLLFLSALQLSNTTRSGLCQPTTGYVRVKLQKQGECHFNGKYAHSLTLCTEIEMLSDPTAHKSDGFLGVRPH